MIESEDIISDMEIEELGNLMRGELRNCISSDNVYDTKSGICLIPRMHEHIRAIDRHSYEPIMLSIGPYRNGSPALSSMEKEKWNCLDYILRLNCEKGLKDYFTVIKRLEKQARMCYSGDIKMNKRRFLRTLLLDGCFALVSLGKFNEFIRAGPQRSMASSSNAEIHEKELSSGNTKVTERNEIEQISTSKKNAVNSTVMEEDVVNDKHSRGECSVPEIELCSETSGHQTERRQYQTTLNRLDSGMVSLFYMTYFLLENQIPFFIVEGIYEVVISNKIAPTTCKPSIAQYIERYASLYPTAIQECSRPEDFSHLLHLCHMYFRPSSNQDDEHHSHTVPHGILYFLHLAWGYLNLNYKQETANLGLSRDGHLEKRWHRATQYHEAGIEFRRRTYSERCPHSLLDILLKDGFLEIPFLFLDEGTNVHFRNLVALEQQCPQVGNDITAYIIFLAKLMSMPDDVALLAQKGVIAHHMRTDRDVSQLFTKLTKGVVFDFHGNYYLENLCLALEVYYQNRLHRWVAWLRHNHLSNPWLIVAALAGVIVLFCTIAQTVLTVQSYVNPS